MVPRSAFADEPVASAPAGRRVRSCWRRYVVARLELVAGDGRGGSGEGAVSGKEGPGRALSWARSKWCSAIMAESGRSGSRWVRSRSRVPVGHQQVEGARRRWRGDDAPVAVEAVDGGGDLAVAVLVEREATWARSSPVWRRFWVSTGTRSACSATRWANMPPAVTAPCCPGHRPADSRPVRSTQSMSRAKSGCRAWTLRRRATTLRSSRTPTHRLSRGGRAGRHRAGLDPTARPSTSAATPGHRRAGHPVALRFPGPGRDVEGEGLARPGRAEHALDPVP